MIVNHLQQEEVESNNNNRGYSRVSSRRNHLQQHLVSTLTTNRYLCIRYLPFLYYQMQPLVDKSRIIIMHLIHTRVHLTSHSLTLEMQQVHYWHHMMHTYILLQHRHLHLHQADQIVHHHPLPRLT